MTHALVCDGCGRLASDRDPLDSDPTRRWWVLSRGPTPGGAMLALALPSLDFDPNDDEEQEQEQEEPERHYCSTACLRLSVAALEAP